MDYLILIGHLHILVLHIVADYGVPFTVGDAGVVGEEDSVVGQHRVTGGQDAPRRLAHAVQDAVIHQEVID